MVTSVPLPPMGACSYSHRRTMKLPAAQAQARTAMDDVTSRVGTRIIRATPIQKSEKRTAAPRAKATVDRLNVTKRRIGRKAKRS